MIESLATEFGHEAATTRRLLARLPADRLQWRPHPKSFTAGGLASHIVGLIGFAEPIFNRAGLDIDPGTYKVYEAASASELLETFDSRAAACSRILAGVSDADLMEPWQFKIKGRLRFEKTRAAVFRDFILSHMIHHRGQLSVYLRLLDVPVPGSYGPTADE